MALDFICTSNRGYDYFGCTEKLDGRNYIPSDFGKYQIILTKNFNFIPKIFACTDSQRRGEKILSHIIPVGKDNANRPGNFLAHHLVIEKDELLSSCGGPAWLLKKRAFCQQWETGKSKEQYKKTVIQPNDYLKIDPAHTWRDLLYDNWQSQLQSVIETIGDPKKKCIILFDKEKHSSELILDLFYEALSWVEPEKRWNVTFSSYAIEPLKSLGWQWIGVDRTDEISKRIFLSNNPIIIELPLTSNN
ncbi:MAG: hypothetical protein LBB88_10660 [Planctomycetaceae bacterium]|jgi:hypothetical protein|nr:hypothetical protein [Planctomycetaceae bacterium]